MARKWFLLGLFLLAASVGVVGFQVLYYLIVGNWPAVSIALVSGTLLDGHAPGWRWLGVVPVSIAGGILAYLAFLLSDTLRRR